MVVGSTHEQTYSFVLKKESEGDMLVEFTITYNIIDCMVGDVNGDETWNVLDIVSLANCVMADECDDYDDGGCAGDVNVDVNWNVLDIVALANCLVDDSCGG